MNTPEKKYSEEQSQNIVSVMKLFARRSLKEFPIQSVTSWMAPDLISIERGTIKMSLTVRPEMTNPAGFFHGGMQCALMDDAMGWVCATLGYDRAHLSINLTADYLGTAKAGDIVTVESEVYREGGTLLYTIAEIKKDQTVIARGQSNLFISNQKVDYKSFIGLLKHTKSAE